jgi:hypothetical protein
VAGTDEAKAVVAKMRAISIHRAMPYFLRRN